MNFVYAFLTMAMSAACADATRIDRCPEIIDKKTTTSKLIYDQWIGNRIIITRWDKPVKISVIPLESPHVSDITTLREIIGEQCATVSLLTGLECFETVERYAGDLLIVLGVPRSRIDALEHLGKIQTWRGQEHVGVNPKTYFSEASSTGVKLEVTTNQAGQAGFAVCEILRKSSYSDEVQLRRTISSCLRGALLVGKLTAVDDAALIAIRALYAQDISSGDAVEKVKSKIMSVIEGCLKKASE